VPAKAGSGDAPAAARHLSGRMVSIAFGALRQSLPQYDPVIVRPAKSRFYRGGNIFGLINNRSGGLGLGYFGLYIL